MLVTFSQEDLHSMHSHASNALAIKQGFQTTSKKRKYWVHSPDKALRDVKGQDKLNLIATKFYDWIGKESHTMSTMTGSLSTFAIILSTELCCCDMILLYVAIVVVI